MVFVDFAAYRDTFSLAMNDAEHFLSFMHSLSDMGAAMRRVMGLALTNTTMYKYLTEGKGEFARIKRCVWGNLSKFGIIGSQFFFSFYSSFIISVIII